MNKIKFIHNHSNCTQRQG